MLLLQAELAAGVVFLDKVAGVVAAVLSGTTSGGASDLSVTFTTTAACKAAVANLTAVTATIIIDTEKFMSAKPNMVNGYHVPGQLAEKVRVLFGPFERRCPGDAAWLGCGACGAGLGSNACPRSLRCHSQYISATA